MVKSDSTEIRANFVFHSCSEVAKWKAKKSDFLWLNLSLEYMMNSRADTSIHSMTITTLSLYRVSVSILGSALPVALTVPVLSDVTVRLPITSPSCLLSPCPSFQRSAARCCIMGKSRNLALRKSLRSWCWHRRCWRRSDAVSHSSPSGNLWTRRQMKPMNVGISNF